MKKIVLLLVLSGLAFGLSACGKSAQEKLAEEQLNEREKAKAWGEAYKKNQAKAYEDLQKKLGKQ